MAPCDFLGLLAQITEWMNHHLEKVTQGFKAFSSSPYCPLPLWKPKGLQCRSLSPRGGQRSVHQPSVMALHGKLAMTGQEPRLWVATILPRHHSASQQGHPVQGWAEGAVCARGTPSMPYYQMQNQGSKKSSFFRSKTMCFLVENEQCSPPKILHAECSE